MVDTYKQSLSSKTLFITHFNDVKVIQDLLMSIDRYCGNVLDLLCCLQRTTVPTIFPNNVNGDLISLEPFAIICIRIID